MLNWVKSRLTKILKISECSESFLNWWPCLFFVFKKIFNNFSGHWFFFKIILLWFKELIQLKVFFRHWWLFFFFFKKIFLKGDLELTIFFPSFDLFIAISSLFFFKKNPESLLPSLHFHFCFNHPFTPEFVLPKKIFSLPLHISMWAAPFFEQKCISCSSPYLYTFQCEQLLHGIDFSSHTRQDQGGAIWIINGIGIKPGLVQQQPDDAIGQSQRTGFMHISQVAIMWVVPVDIKLGVGLQQPLELLGIL